MRSKLKHWKEEVEERHQMLSKQELQESALTTGIQQVIAILQMPVTVNSIRTKVELNVLNACRRFAGLRLINMIFESQEADAIQTGV
jgi:hypothetical protein